MGQSVTKYGMKTSETLREEYFNIIKDHPPYFGDRDRQRLDKLFEAVMDVRDMLQGFLDAALADDKDVKEATNDN
jgi:hypothetical protein